MKNLYINPFDIVLAIVILIGVARGRKKGISEELLPVIEWIAIVVLGAFAYRLIGGLLITYAGFSNLFGHIVGYLINAAVMVIIFKSIRRMVGDKLIQTDTFGRLEFHLGSVGGAVRAFCMILFVMAMLYAKYSTPAERAARAKQQEELYGSSFFPTIEGIQQWVFFESFTGGFIRTNMSVLLIQPQPPGPVRPDNSIKSRRERTVNETIEGLK
jgi:uncharacterized membrane protein required for colicin V production